MFAPHAAADGALARIRLLGGAITPEQLATLARVSADHGDGFIDLTARANVQLRGITDVDAVASELVDAGLVPSTTHEKVRNIEVSPFTGRVGGLLDLRPVVRRLDEALRDDAELSALSGRFLFGLDDGHADIARGNCDVCAYARSAADGSVTVDILIDGEDVGSVGSPVDVIGALLAVAHDLLDIAPGAWRVSDLAPRERSALIERSRRRLDEAHAQGRSAESRRPEDGHTADGHAQDGHAQDGHAQDGHAEGVLADDRVAIEAAAPRVGWFDQSDGNVLLGAVVELGRLPARLAEFIAAVGAPVVFTPDREILICDLGEGVAETVVRVLAPMGLIFDASSPWTQVSACAGAPGCAHGQAPVRVDAVARVESGGPVAEREHWVGCDRGCGSPPQPHRRVEATESGYRATRR
ncbi:nitrite/sulfite reductase [Gordonia otitidis]|uniref:nitrite/sulfite reductase n=1 Tax=Gordonia otitidis TaxID=249058 RepID=UPI001D135AF5|nr:nitrite/sulfite reductase [Gordonia otitidis]UEA61718.1 nitrite/sulfite reductase [Gordonia otitidis]